MTPKRFNPFPVLKPRWCPVHQAMEREECGLARTEYGREVVEERERATLTTPSFSGGTPPEKGSPTYEEQYPSRELIRLRKLLADAQAEIKRLKTPPPPEPKKGIDI